MRLLHHLKTVIDILKMIPQYFHLVSSVPKIANRFLEDDNVSEVRIDIEGTNIYVDLLLEDDDIDCIGLRYAEIEIELRDELKIYFTHLSYYDKKEYLNGQHNENDYVFKKEEKN
ncbi:hypothetical protein D3C74_416930 [compost metagenome]